MEKISKSKRKKDHDEVKEKKSLHNVKKILKKILTKSDKKDHDKVA